MKIPVLTGMIRRRVLVNYRVEPEVAANLLPKEFRPRLYRGKALAGICLIRLEEVRPRGLPAMMGIASENAAHRFAVEWLDASGSLQEGVYIVRRDTDSKLNAVAGGRLFPGTHNRARFQVRDDGLRLALKVENGDGDGPLVDIEGEEAPTLAPGSIFPSLQESSRFFETGSIGYSPSLRNRSLDGLKLVVKNWQVAPLAVAKLHSAYFDNPTLFPPDAIRFDHALVMRNIAHEWHSAPAWHKGRLETCAEAPAMAPG